MLVAWAIAILPLFVFPAQDQPSRADAIVVLAGAAEERVPVAQQLHSDDAADILAISDSGGPDDSYADHACATNEQPDVICFSPIENSTRGEARSIGRLAQTHGWTSIIVVTSTYHLRRATMLVSQVTRVDIYGVASRPTISVAEWVWHLVHEPVGLLDALVRPEKPV